MENHYFNGKIHYKWPFSIAMLVYQRVQTSFSDTTEVPPVEPRGKKTPAGSQQIHHIARGQLQFLRATGNHHLGGHHRSQALYGMGPKG